MSNKIVPLVSTDPRVSIGKYTYGSPTFLLWNSEERIEIGSFCSIALDVSIFGGGEHITEWVTTYPLRIAFEDTLAYRDGLPATKGPTRIGHDVWIGYRATVLSGVRIGDGAVIGAGSVVARDVPPYTIVAGNPARIVRSRFAPDQVAALLDIKWWNWPDDQIRKHISLLCSSQIDFFIDSAKKMDISQTKDQGIIKKIFRK